jgi:hypothetical protein
MGTTDHKPLSELPHRFRERLAALRTRWRDYRDECRETPGIARHRPLLKIGALILVVLAAILGVRWLTSWITPGGSASLADQRTPTATLYVACTNPGCRTFFTTLQPMDFKNWPLKCAGCGALAVYRATQCPTCRHWHGLAPGGPVGCPFCAEKTQQAEPFPTSRATPHHSDDDEDPWR